MKRTLCLFVMFCLLCSPLHAGGTSPGFEQFHCTLHPTLNVTGILNDPFDRWARELADLIEVDVQCAHWPEGQAMRVEVRTGGVHAFDVELSVVGEQIGMKTSLTDDRWVLFTGDEALDALRLVDNACAVLWPETDWPLADCTLTLHADRTAEQLTWCTRMLKRWFEDVDETDHDRAGAVISAFEAGADLATHAERSAPLVDVFVDYQASNFVPGKIGEDAPAAPEGLLISLAAQIPMVLGHTIAGLSATEHLGDVIDVNDLEQLDDSPAPSE